MVSELGNKVSHRRKCREIAQQDAYTHDVLTEGRLRNPAGALVSYELHSRCISTVAEWERFIAGREREARSCHPQDGLAPLSFDSGQGR